MLRLAFGLLVLTVAFAGCSDDADTHDHTTMDAPLVYPDPVTFNVRAMGIHPLTGAYDLTELEAASGANVTVHFRNDDLFVEHNIVFTGLNETMEPIGPTRDATVTFQAPAAGTYEFYCSVAGHKDAYHGTLTVTAHEGHEHTEQA